MAKLIVPSELSLETTENKIGWRGTAFGPVVDIRKKKNRFVWYEARGCLNETTGVALL